MAAVAAIAVTNHKRVISGWKQELGDTAARINHLERGNAALNRQLRLKTEAEVGALKDVHAVARASVVVIDP